LGHQPLRKAGSFRVIHPFGFVIVRGDGMERAEDVGVAVDQLATAIDEIQGTLCCRPPLGVQHDVLPPDNAVVLSVL
jgi:hypothetical protein